MDSDRCISPDVTSLDFDPQAFSDRPENQRDFERLKQIAANRQIPREKSQKKSGSARVT
jgi:hypothetical protein